MFVIVLSMEWLLALRNCLKRQVRPGDWCWLTAVILKYLKSWRISKVPTSFSGLDWTYPRLLRHHLLSGRRCSLCVYKESSSQIAESHFSVLHHRQLRDERPGQQPAERTAAASQEPGGGYGGGHPQHHPRDRDGQLGERPLPHLSSSHRQAGGHQPDQVGV